MAIIFNILKSYYNNNNLYVTIDCWTKINDEQNWPHLWQKTTPLFVPFLIKYLIFCIYTQFFWGVHHCLENLITYHCIKERMSIYFVCTINNVDGGSNCTQIKVIFLPIWMNGHELLTRFAFLIIINRLFRKPISIEKILIQHVNWQGAAHRSKTIWTEEFL